MGTTINFLLLNHPHSASRSDCAFFIIHCWSSNGSVGYIGLAPRQETTFSRLQSHCQVLWVSSSEQPVQYSDSKFVNNSQFGSLFNYNCFQPNTQRTCRFSWCWCRDWIQCWILLKLVFARRSKFWTGFFKCLYWTKSFSVGVLIIYDVRSVSFEMITRSGRRRKNGTVNKVLFSVIKMYIHTFILSCHL